MSMTVSSIVTLSIVLSIAGIGVFGYLTVLTWKQFRAHPCNRCSWMFMASLTLTWAMSTLLITGIGAAYVGLEGEDADALNLLRHLGMVMRGGLVALAVALAYGWRRISKEATR